MGTISAAERALPPGLILPTAEESTAQYLRENFDHDDHTFDDVVRYSSLVVALAVMAPEPRNRVTNMPGRYEFNDMHRAGYGISYKRVVQFGVARIQRSQGFYPRGFYPTRGKLTQRMEWMAQHAIDKEVDFGRSKPTVNQIIDWGSVRNLLPPQNKTYEIFDGDTTEIRRIFDIEKPYTPRHHTYYGMYKFGAKVIREHGAPLYKPDLNKEYADAFLEVPTRAITALFGGTTRFWLEYDYVPNSHGLGKKDLVDIAVRIAIRSGNPTFDDDRILALSKEKRFASLEPIYNYFENIADFQNYVDEGIQEYCQIQKNFVAQGVSVEMFELACQKFETGYKFGQTLRPDVRILVKLSSPSPNAEYIRTRIRYGLNLEDDAVYLKQFQELQAAILALGIDIRADIEFVFGLIPRLNAREAFLQPQLGLAQNE